ncbi:MAG: efflux RND transporter periplasmic adaptor subunit [Steroidobacteraceae bacterium]
MLKTRIVSWGLAGLALAAIILWALRDPAVEVEVGIVSTGPLLVTLDQEGRTHVEDRYLVSAPVAGLARRIELRPGANLAPGQSIAVLEPLAASALDPRSLAEARAELARAEAEVRSAKADSEAAAAASTRARQRDERLAQALQSGAVSRDEADAAALDRRAADASARAAAYRVELAEAGRRAARARVEVAGGTRSSQEAIILSSPIEACVLKVEHESEGVVQAGTPLLELGCRESMEVHADVLSADAVNLTPGQAATIEDWGGEGSLSARVLLIEPQAFTEVSALGVEEQRVRVVLELLDPLERWSSLGDGYRVMVRFLVWQGEDVLQVPASALFEHDGQAQVFAVEGDGILSQRAVTIGQRNPEAAQVLDGLTAGEAVVLHPRRELAPGQRVRRRTGG